ncbi:RagB/SusD family nutrient uptake outer membrane protein [Polaribacter tangerinus]|uniref:RagB/SusD family nutrient uptake outer membrane protein n=1 Tax=Polaribacter tangerinus TaxID=1920034 RepID=UPI000B4C1C56|nr:RagB/SusD family nutrient uptake outer membrane protein [Polaribacter tangerinus]
MKFKFYYVVSFFLFFLNSCAELDENPKGFYTDQNFFKSEDEVESAILYAYIVNQTNEYLYGYIELTDLSSEIMYCTPTNTFYGRNEIDLWQVSPLTLGIQGFYKYSYIGVNRANTVLDNINSVDIEISKKNHFKGELYFIRAWHYFNLVRLFGEVPLRKSSVTSSEDLFLPKSNIQEVYDFIIEDLTNAIDLMQIERKYGRADKVAAQSLLSKVFLTLASSKECNSPRYNWVLNSDEMYNQAKEYAGKVIFDQSIYELQTDLWDIFDVNNKMNSENIYFLSTNREKSVGKSGFAAIWMPNPGVSYSTDFHVSHPFLTNTYLPTTWGYRVYRISNQFVNTHEPGDLRKNLYSNMLYNADGSLRATYNEHYFSLKYIDPEWIDWDKTSSSPLYLRMSDIALVYAEASGATSLAYQQINKIRNRAGLSDLQPGLSDLDFREAVRNERKFELSGEGNRLFELRRTNKVIETLGNVTYPYLYPLPQNEVDVNPKIDFDPEKINLK